MAQPTRERKQAGLQLAHLAPVEKGSKRSAKDAQHPDAQLENVAESGTEDRWRPGVQAVDPEEIDEICQ